MQTKTDFLGNEYEAGDYVIYAQSAGRCINMVKGQVVEIKEDGRVRIQPIAGSRWKSHHGQSYSVDSRTGKKINPWAASGIHIKTHSYYLAEDGTKYSSEEYYNLHWSERDRQRFKYIPTVFHDYVETRTDAIKPVTISVTENIVKFADGELGTEV